MSSTYLSEVRGEAHKDTQIEARVTAAGESQAFRVQPTQSTKRSKGITWKGEAYCTKALAIKEFQKQNVAKFWLKKVTKNHSDFAAE